jgi:hypothetical protein
MLSRKQLRLEIAKSLAASPSQTTYRNNLLGTADARGNIEPIDGHALTEDERDLAYEAFEDLRKRGFIHSKHQNVPDSDNWVVITGEGLRALEDGSLEKRIIFLSHAAADQRIANRLKQIIEQTIPATDVFVSSDPEDLPPGSPWIEKIRDALRVAEAYLIVATTRSMVRKWVWLEAGAGWAREVVVVPGCLGGVRKNALPAPFLMLTALNLDSPEDLRALLLTLAGTDGVSVRLGDIKSLASELQEIEQGVANAEGEKLHLDSAEIDRRLNEIHLSATIESGLAANFLITFTNRSEEDITITQIVLERQGIELTKPFYPPSPNLWKLHPQRSLPIGNAANPNPAAQLFELNSTKGLGFRDTIEIIVSCRALGRTTTFRIKKLVIVTTNFAIKEIAG